MEPFIFLITIHYLFLFFSLLPPRAKWIKSKKMFLILLCIPGSFVVLIVRFIFRVFMLGTRGLVDEYNKIGTREE